MQPKVLLAALCDPRMKSLNFIPDTDRQAMWEVALELIVDHREKLNNEQQNDIDQDSSSDDDDQEDGHNDEPAHQRQRLNEDGEHADIFADLQQRNVDLQVLERENRQQIEDHLRIELRQYQQEKPLAMYTDETRQTYNNPLEWWKRKQTVYPNVALFAKRLLCIPATSAPAERLFSHAGLILSKLRASLTPENAQNLILLHDNWQLVEEYSGGNL